MTANVTICSMTDIKSKYQRRLTPQQCQTICDLYINERLSATEIAEQLKEFSPTIVGVLKRYHIPMRAKSEAIKLAFQRGRKIRPIAERNPNWSGGIIERSGYRLLWKPDYVGARKSGYVAEHRYIWEKAHGLLPQSWVIHHLNGIKNDNRLENLIALPTKFHPSGRHKTKKDYIITALRKRITQLETQLNQLPLSLD